MAFSASTITVTGTATALVQPNQGSPSDPLPVAIFNNDGAATLFIGGAGVTTANGFPILKQTGITMRLMVGESVFGIVTAGSLDTRVLIGRT